MVTQPQKGKKELCNRTHNNRNEVERMKKEILEIVERAYNASQKAHKAYRTEVDLINERYINEARLNALTEAKNVYYETLRSNEEKALNEVNTILDQATERVKTIITNTPDESFYRDIQIIKLYGLVIR